MAFSKALAARGSAYVHVSSGGLSSQQKIDVGPGYQLPFAQEIKRQVEVPVIGVGIITTPEQAETAIRDGSADLVALARGILYDCLLYTSPSPRDATLSRMPSSA